MRRNSYPTDLTDEQWRRIEPWVPKPKPGGRPALYSRREILNAILYQTRNGGTWRALPHDLPPYRIVFHYFRLWQKNGTWDRLHAALRQRVRQEAGKTPKPTAAILDSQTVKTTEQGGPKGYDGGKKTVGRKRHLVVDTLGLLWALVLTPASVSDAEGGKQALRAFRGQVKRPRIIWVDAAYHGTAKWAYNLWAWVLEIVRRPWGRFVVQPKRWIVERTFGWWNRARRLSKDYERTIESSSAFIHVTMIHLMLRRLAP